MTSPARLHRALAELAGESSRPSWGSPRELLAHLYSARKGPRPARPRWSREPAVGHRSSTAWVLAGCLLYQDPPDGCGVAIGSALDDELREWSLGHGERSAAVRRVEDRLRALLRAHDLLAVERRHRARRNEGEVVSPPDLRGQRVVTVSLSSVFDEM